MCIVYGSSWFRKLPIAIASKILYGKTCLTVPRGINFVDSVKCIHTALNCGIPWLIRESIMMFRLEILIAPVTRFREMRFVCCRIVHLGDGQMRSVSLDVNL